MSTLTPLSPSLRGHVADPKHHPRKIEQCFDECAELPALLVGAAVGDYAVFRALLVYRQLNHSFRQLVKDELARWCIDYEAQKQRVLHHWANQNVRLFYKERRILFSVFDRSFGKSDAVSLARFVSRYTPAVYMDIAFRRCSICKAPVIGLRGNRADPGHKDAAMYTYSHTACEDSHCLRASLSELVGAPPMGASKLVNFNRASLRDKMNAVMHEHPFATGDALVQTTSPLTQYRSSCAYSCTTVPPMDQMQYSLVRWVVPHPLVNDADTLFGQAGITQEMVQAALFNAESRRAEVRLRAEAQRARKASDEQTVIANRRGMAIVQLAGAKIPWCTPEALDEFSPHMRRACGLTSFIANGIGNPQTVVRSAAFIADTLSGASQRTIDFMLEIFPNRFNLVPTPPPDWHFRGSAWKRRVDEFRRIVVLVDSFDANRFTLALPAGVPCRRGTEGGLPIVQGRRMLTKFTATTYWPGTADTVASCNTAPSDQDLLVLRAEAQLDDDVDLESALVATTSDQLEECVNKILGAALDTDKRAVVLELLGVRRVIENLIDNGLGDVA